MDAKTGTASSHDFIRKHSYEQVFSTSLPAQPPRFIQSTAQQPSHGEGGAAAPFKADEDEEGAAPPPQQQQKNSPLFWVNSDPQTVKRGSKEETLKRIRSHVMSEHNRKKRLENTRRYNKSKAWKNLAFRPEPPPASKLARAIEASISSPPLSSAGSARSSSKSSSSPENRGYSLKGTMIKPKSAGSRSAGPKNTESKNTGSENTESKNAGSMIAGSRPSETSMVRTSSPSDIAQNLQIDRPPQDVARAPPPRVRTGEVDPFLTAQVRLSETQYQHLKFFLYNLIPQAAPFIYHGVSKLRRHWVALTQSNPSALFACITSAATNKALMSGHFFADPDTQRNSPLILDRLRNRGETISLINRDLSCVSSASSDAVIAAVSVLISIEITGSQDIAIHLNGLRKMVALRKNFSDIATNVRWQVEWTDIRAACKTMSKPLFPFIRYAMPAHTPAEVLVENAGILASSLRAIGRIPGIFGLEMCRLIDNLTSVTLYAEIYKTQPKRAAVIFDEEIEEYFNNEVLYTEYCLLNDRWTMVPNDDNDTTTRNTNLVPNDTTLEGATRLASLLFHNTALWPFYPSIAPLFPMPILTLQTAVRTGLARGYYDSAPGLLIWILFVGASAAKYLPPCRAFFMDELVAVVRHPPPPPPSHSHFYSYSRSQSHHSSPSSGLSPTSSSPSPSSTTTTATSMSTSSSSSSSLPGLETFEDFRCLLQGYLYVDRCYLAEAREIYATLFGAESN